MTNVELNEPKTTTSRTLRGVVVSDKMVKTVRVRVDRLKKHPKYKKYFKVSRSFMAQAETGQCQMGDRVVIAETRPLSKTKRWRVISKL